MQNNNKKKKLTLRTESLRQLSSREMEQVGGAALKHPTCWAITTPSSSAVITGTLVLADVC